MVVATEPMPEVDAFSSRREARARRKGQRAIVVWLTGLSAAGKSTIAGLVEARLHAEGRHTYLLDGDRLRTGLNRDLGFAPADRAENVRRAAEVAALMIDAGLIVVAAFISPYRADREFARSLIPPGDFIEVHVDVPLHIAEQRDPKGLYRRARAGELREFTGIDAPYEAPVDPELYLDTSVLSAEESADRVLRRIEAHLARGFGACSSAGG
jgi:adenylyl-sulfate kinase